MRRKLFRYLSIVIVALFAAIQFYQPDRTNPPENPAETFEAVAKPAPEVLSIVRRACGDCHSNKTVWPWYSRIAPVSWVVADDVSVGRSRLNFSEWSAYGAELSGLKLKDACKLVRDGEMPLWLYRLAHPEARLSQSDIESLCRASNQAPGTQ